MPKQLTVADPSGVTRRWTITSYTVVPPTLPAPLDGSAAVTVTEDIIMNGEVLSTRALGYTVSAKPFYALLADVGLRLAALLASKVAPDAAYYAATRDALYALLIEAGVIPPEAA